MGYLEPNINKIEAVGIIKHHIDNETPFLFSRFGDGEMWLLKKEINHIRKKRIFHEWGVNDDNYLNIVNRVSGELIDSFNSCDLVGIMGKNHLDYGVSIKYDPDTWSIDVNRARGIGLDVKDNITDHLLCRGTEIGDPNNFKNILNNKKIHIISPNSDILKLKKLDDILECEITYTKINRNPNSLIYHKDELLTEVSKIKENIVLFGMGAAGKSVGSYLKNNHNKLCLDFGSTLDGWSNIRSRPWFNTTQQHLLIK